MFTLYRLLNFSCRHKNLSSIVRMNSNCTPVLEQAVRFSHIKPRTWAVGREGSFSINPSPYFWIYLLPSQWVPVLFPSYFLPLRSEYPSTLHQGVAQTPPPGPPEAEPIRCVTIHFRDWHGAALLRYRNSTQITVVMCSRSLIRSDFRACAEATRYSVNITAWIWMWTRQNAFLSLNTASLISQKI